MIDNLLDELSKKKHKFPEYVHLHEGVSASYINKIQQENNFTLPISYCKFLQRFNGGFITIIGADSCVKTQEWNSNNLLGIEAIADAYNRIRYKFDKSEKEKFIPFIHTKIGEYLGFLNPLISNESIVYDLWHEVFPNDWKEQDIYNNFEDLLEDYVHNNGIIMTM